MKKGMFGVTLQVWIGFLGEVEGKVHGRGHNVSKGQG